VSSLPVNPIGNATVTEYRSIQTLRGVAATMVAMMHVLFFYPQAVGDKPPMPYMASFYHLRGFGGSGIQIFFVISGFIMAYLNAIGETKSFFQFMVRRITRIAPLYWMATLFFAYVVVPGHFSTERVIDSLFFILRPDNSTVVGPGWSLNFEMIFYVIFGLITLTFRVSFVWVGLVFLAFGALSEATNFYFFTLMSDPIVWCFFAGIVIFHTHRLPFVQKNSRSIFVAGLVILLSAIFWHTADKSYGVRQFLPWGVPSMMIVLGAVSMEDCGKGRRIFGNRILLVLGNASYSIYLMHEILFFRFPSLLFDIIGIQKWAGPDVAALFFLASLVAIGVVIHYLIEKPLTRLVRALTKPLLS
jgi:exopolysaccharide production protein ExoZ